VKAKLQDKSILQRLPTMLFSLILLVLLIYAIVLVAIWWKQEKLLFAPTVLSQNHAFNIRSDVQERLIEVDGAKLSALHLRVAKPKAVVLFLHGNGGSLDTWFVNTDFYRSMNVDLMMIDYRGYGKSSGTISSEQQLHNDVAKAFALIKVEYPSLPMVLIGRSLGTGLASKLYSSLAPPLRPELMILVSPFYNLKELAALHFAFVPSALVRYPMRSDLALASLGPEKPGRALTQSRMLLLHGDKDSLIPLEHSQRLVTLQSRLVLKIIKGGAHNDLQDFPAYLDAIRESIAAL
jgi:uncharacterized protein